MKRHYEEKHIPVDEDDAQEIEVAPSSKRQKVMDTFVDRRCVSHDGCTNNAFVPFRFTAQEQMNAELAQAFSLVMNGQSFRSLDQPWTTDFLRCLRADFVPLSRHTVERRIKELEAGTPFHGQSLLPFPFSTSIGVRDRVLQAITSMGVVTRGFSFPLSPGSPFVGVHA